MKSLTFRSFTFAACVISSSLVFAGPFMEPFAGASNFSLIVAGDASFGHGVHVHGAGYFGGNLTVKGSNTGFGQSRPAGSLGLVVGGNVSSANGNSQQIAMFNKSYSIGGTTTKINWQNPGSKLDSSPLTLNPVAVAAALNDTANYLASQTSIGATINASDLNNVMITLTSGITNVLNLNASNASFLSHANANINFKNFTDGTKLIINYDLGDADFMFKAKNQGLNALAYDDVIWNFVGDKKVTIANSVSTFKGTLFAANSLVDWKANDIDGQLVAKSLNWQNTSQSHYFNPWSPWEAPKLPDPPKQPGTPSNTPESVPEPELMLLLLSALAGLGLTRKSARQ